MGDGLHEHSLIGVLEELARSRAGHTAYVDGAKRISYREARERVHRLANAWAAMGVGAGDRVLWLAQNSYRVVEGVCAASLLGAMFCPANWRQSPEEMAFVIDDFSPKIVIWQEEEIGEAVRGARALAAHRDAVWIQQDGVDEYEPLIAGADAAEGRHANDPTKPALVVYTAAFEGAPNGAMLSQRAILTQSLVVQFVQDLTPSAVFLNSGPMFHVGTLMTTFAVFTQGGTNVFVRRTDAEQLCTTIHQERCTFAFLMMKVCEDIVKLNADGRYDLKCLTSPPFFPEWDAMVTINPRDTRNTAYGYGQTEVNGLVSWTFYNAPGDKGVSGRPAPGTQIRIVDADDQEVADGEVGEIVVRGPTVMCGYWNRPALNAQRQRNGWHHTNDLGRREADGSLSFVGPKTQMIKSGAENIYPAEVEGCLRRHEAVADAAIIGVPDPLFTQSVKAIVQLRDGASCTPGDLIEHCRLHLASYKKPRTVEFIDALPRTKAGGVDYRALDERFGGGNYPGQAWQTTRRA
ncbi:MAG: AMP-binding protein [Hydrogenophilaceae bacterium]|jgi:long-chain acyl-CoA synthetase|nr:AMP-binding protein [Hydrogenophilaceae bacterium]